MRAQLSALVFLCAAARAMALCLSMGGKAPLGIGVLGCGRIGQIHALSIASRTAGARLVAISDPFEEAAKKVLDATGNVPAYFKDYLDVVQHPDVEAVVIASPTPFHVEQLQACARNKKHVYCEKPVSNDVKAFDNCLQMVEESGIKLVVGFQRRFDSNFATLRRQIQDGVIGDVRTFHITSRDPSPPPAEYLRSSGGIFLDMTSHDFDMARFLVDDEIEEVFSVGYAFDPEAQQANDFDTAITTLKFKNGAFGTIENSRRCSFGYDQRVEVFGKKGALAGANKGPDTIVHYNEHGIGQGVPYSFFMDRYAEAYVSAMSAFASSIGVNSQDSGVFSPAYGWDGKQALLAGLAALKSSRVKRPVTIAEVEAAGFQLA